MKTNKIILAISIILLSSTISAGCMMMGGGGMDMGSGEDMGGMDMEKKAPAKTKQAPNAQVNMSKCGDSKDMEKASDMNQNYIPIVSSQSKSFIIAKRYCSQCHVMRLSDEFTKNEWKPILRRMIGYMQKQARLKPDSYEKVMIEHYYLD